MEKEPILNPNATGIVPSIIRYIGGFLSIFQSRTRTVAIVGAVAYFLNKFTGVQIDETAATNALTNAAQNPPLTVEDLIVLAVTAGVTYFHANQRVVHVDSAAKAAPPAAAPTP